LWASKDISDEYKLHRSVSEEQLDVFWSPQNKGRCKLKEDPNSLNRMQRWDWIRFKFNNLSHGKKGRYAALKTFIMEIGAPGELTIDGSKEQNAKGSEFMKNCRRNNTQVTKTEPECPNQ
jgi:hypothetical protein